MERTLPNVDIFLPSIEEILFMVRRETFDSLDQQATDHDILPLLTPDLLSDLSTQLLALGPKIVGFKLVGYKGFYLRTAGRKRIEAIGRAGPFEPTRWANIELWAPCFQANLVGAAGSGDATIAGFLGRLLRGYSPEEATIAAWP